MSAVKTYDEHVARIEEALEQDGPFSHNIIMLVLQMIARDCGRAEANRAMRECGLLDLGWRGVAEVVNG